MNNLDAWLSDNNGFLPGRLLLGNQPVLTQMAVINLTGKTGISGVKIRPPDDSAMPKSGGF